MSAIGNPRLLIFLVYGLCFLPLKIQKLYLTCFVKGSVANENSKWKGIIIPIVICSNVFPICGNLHSDSVQ